jgi:general L-amino acid transport system substrate-binding protein
MKTLKLLFACFLVIAFASFAIAETTISPILTNAQATDTLIVGIDSLNTIGMIGGYNPGGNLPKKPGVPYGLEIDFARAVAAAIGVSNIEWIKVDGNDYEDRWAFLNAPIGHPNHVDVVITQSTLTSIRDTSYAGTGFEWSPIYYYDGTRVLIDPDRPPAVGPKYNIYVQYEVSNYFDLLRYEASGNMPSTWNIITGEAKPGETFVAGTHNGDVVHGVTSDGIRLSSIKAENAPNNWVFWPVTLSKSPFAAATVEDDENWAEIVRWTFNVLFEAEERGYGKGDAAPVGWLDPVVPGLAPGWSQDVIDSVGNYKDVWERAFGVGSDRGLNKLWNAEPPGLLYSPPF